jgi:signal transduction histidine kinase
MSKLLNQESAVISVLDNGPGIRAEEARELFSDFFVGASGRAKGGIGLGLSITKEIVHAHGGSVEARTSDSGGCFVITIPLNREDD